MLVTVVTKPCCYSLKFFYFWIDIFVSGPDQQLQALSIVMLTSRSDTPLVPIIIATIGYVKLPVVQLVNQRWSCNSEIWPITTLEGAVDPKYLAPKIDTATSYLRPGPLNLWLYQPRSNADGSSIGQSVPSTEILHRYSWSYFFRSSQQIFQQRRNKHVYIHGT